jgi:hypothetical protein
VIQSLSTGPVRPPGHLKLRDAAGAELCVLVAL